MLIFSPLIVVVVQEGRIFLHFFSRGFIYFNPSFYTLEMFRKEVGKEVGKSGRVERFPIHITFSNLLLTATLFLYCTIPMEGKRKICLLVLPVRIFIRTKGCLTIVRFYSTVRYLKQNFITRTMSFRLCDVPFFISYSLEKS